jgi:hypothetical protein
MNPERQVQEALKALADHDRAREAGTPASVIFARRQPVLLWKTSRWKTWTAVAAAAGLMVFFWLPPAQHVEVSKPMVVSEVKQAPAEARSVPVTAAKPKPSRRVRQPQPEPREVVTEFYPLMDAPPPFERGQLLRVVVPASTMRSVGLPINPQRWSERVQADVLVGEEGMARAIRFVSYEQ